MGRGVSSEAELSRGEESAGQRELGEGRRLRSDLGRRGADLRRLPWGLQPPLEMPLGTPSQQRQPSSLPETLQGQPRLGWGGVVAAFCRLQGRGGWPGSQASSCCFRAGGRLGAVPRGQQRPSQQCPPPQRLPTPGPTHSSGHRPCMIRLVLEKARLLGRGSLPGPYDCALEGHETLCQPWPAGTGPASGAHGRPGSLLPTSPSRGRDPPSLSGRHPCPLEIEFLRVPSFCFL